MDNCNGGSDDPLWKLLTRINVQLEGRGAIKDETHIPPDLRIGHKPDVPGAHDSFGRPQHDLGRSAAHAKEHALCVFCTLFAEVWRLVLLSPEERLSEAGDWKLHLAPSDVLVCGSPVVPDSDPVKESGRPPRHPLEDLMVRRNLGPELILKMGLERPILTCPCPDCSLMAPLPFDSLVGTSIGTVGWLRDVATALLGA